MDSFFALLNKVHLTDALDLMQRVPDECIDLILSSPPFYADDVYILEGEIAEFGWADYSEYLLHIRTVLNELYRITKKGGRLILILTNTPKLDAEENIVGCYPIIYDVFNIAEEIGWKYYTEIIWNKTSASYEDESVHPPSPISFPVNHHDVICVWRKSGELEEYGKYIKYTSVWTLPAAGPISEYNAVYNSFPNSLVRRCLELFSIEGDIVFDPYSGTAQVVRIAIQNNRKAFGSEIDARWRYLWDDISSD